MKRRMNFEEISAFYDGESSLSHDVAHRLREDAESRGAYRECASISALFSALPEPAVRPNFAGDVIREIQARQETPALSWWSSLMRPLATAAAFVVFAGFMAVGVYSTSTTSAPDTAPIAALDIADDAAVSGGATAIASFWKASKAERIASDADASFASDSDWLFAGDAVKAEQPSRTDELILALSEVKYFDRPISPPLQSGADIRTAITNLDDAASRTFLLLLDEYAWDGSAL